MLFLHKLQRILVENIGDVTSMFGCLAIHVEHRIIINTLSLEADPAIKSRTRRIIQSHVPLADKSRFIADIVQKPRKSYQLMTQLRMIGVIGDAMRVWILPDTANNWDLSHQLITFPRLLHD